MGDCTVVWGRRGYLSLPGRAGSTTARLMTGTRLRETRPTRPANRRKRGQLRRRMHRARIAQAFGRPRCGMQFVYGRVPKARRQPRNMPMIITAEMAVETLPPTMEPMLDQKPCAGGRGESTPHRRHALRGDTQGATYEAPEGGSAPLGGNQIREHSLAQPPRVLALSAPAQTRARPTHNAPARAAS